MAQNTPPEPTSPSWLTKRGALISVGLLLAGSLLHRWQPALGLTLIGGGAFYLATFLGRAE